MRGSAAAQRDAETVAWVRSLRADAREREEAVRALHELLLGVARRELGRHFWRAQAPTSADEDWSRLPDRFALDPHRQAEWHDLVEGLRRGVDECLTDHQRRLFVAIVLNAVPLDAMVAELGCNRNAIYKSLYDARRKLRRWLIAHGYLDNGPAT